MNRVFEYAHGSSKRLRTILIPGVNSCSIDPTTGNLAVSSLGNGALYVFKDAKGKATKYKDSQLSTTSAAGTTQTATCLLTG